MKKYYALSKSPEIQPNRLLQFGVIPTIHFYVGSCPSVGAPVSVFYALSRTWNKRPDFDFNLEIFPTARSNRSITEIKK